MEWSDIGDLTLTLFNEDGNDQFNEQQHVQQQPVVEQPPPAPEAPVHESYTRLLDEKFPNDEFYSFVDHSGSGMARSSSLQNLQNIMGTQMNQGAVPHPPTHPPPHSMGQQHGGYIPQNPSPANNNNNNVGNDFSMSPRSDCSGEFKEDTLSSSFPSSSDDKANADGSKPAASKDNKGGENTKALSVREQIRREKNRAAVKKCRKRKNERLKELESLTTKLQEENLQLKDEVKKAKISKGGAVCNPAMAAPTNFAPGPPKIKTEPGEIKITTTAMGEEGAVQIPQSPPKEGTEAIGDAVDTQKGIFHALAEPTEVTDKQLRNARLGSLIKLYKVKVEGSVNDLDGMLEDVYHPEMVLVSRGQENRGVDGIRNQWKRNKNSFPDIRFDSYDIAVQDAAAERITIRWVIRGTLVKQVQYGDMVVPPNNIFNQLKDKEVKLAGYTYLTFAEDDHRIIEELQVIKQGYTYNVEQLKLQAKINK